MYPYIPATTRSLCAGVDLLLAYPSKLYTTPVSVQHCEAFLSQCKARIAVGSKVTDCLEAIWILLKHMQSPALPQATFSTFALATEAVMSGLNQETVPPYHCPCAASGACVAKDAQCARL